MCREIFYPTAIGFFVSLASVPLERALERNPMKVILSQTALFFGILLTLRNRRCGAEMLSYTFGYMLGVAAGLFAFDNYMHFDNGPSVRGPSV